MNEEYPLDDLEKWDFPDKYFDALEELDEDNPRYDIVTGQVYELLRNDTRYSSKDALQVNRALGKGEVDEAWNIVEGELE